MRLEFPHHLRHTVFIPLPVFAYLLGLGIRVPKETNIVCRSVRAATNNARYPIILERKRLEDTSTVRKHFFVSRDSMLCGDIEISLTHVPITARYSGSGLSVLSLLF